MIEEDIKAIFPNELGWLEAKLKDEAIEYLWKTVDKYKQTTDFRKKLAGNLSNSWLMEDENDWFWLNVLEPLCHQYAGTFQNMGNEVPVNHRHPYKLNSFWVNYQREHEFNPYHIHNAAVYSFVVWMQIPTDWREQHKLEHSAYTNDQASSNFVFYPQDILGRVNPKSYYLDKNSEGTILFFPAQLPHAVHPFFNCKEDRITISGNIALDTAP